MRSGASKVVMERPCSSKISQGPCRGTPPSARPRSASDHGRSTMLARSRSLLPLAQSRRRRCTAACATFYSTGVPSPTVRRDTRPGAGLLGLVAVAAMIGPNQKREFLGQRVCELEQYRRILQWVSCPRPGTVCAATEIFGSFNSIKLRRVSLGLGVVYHSLTPPSSSHLCARNL